MHSTRLANVSSRLARPRELKVISMPAVCEGSLVLVAALSHHHGQFYAAAILW